MQMEKWKQSRKKRDRKKEEMLNGWMKLQKQQQQ